ncbi:DUF6916 family protein [Brevibacillus dissolubilis]|uniref:DUF6916 family protein n=1 Tax=Brevibacillus dissolubilis TaxID=1844116 RepID=UPI001116EB69|nr:hypothetical protein [Brevibacillus dissolubilis]
MEELSYAAFLEQVNTTFTIVSPDSTQSVELTLIEAVQTLRDERHENFSLMFQGPLQPQLPQGNYRFVHEQMGEHIMFMVPVGQRQDGMRYEIIFSRMLT